MKKKIISEKSEQLVQSLCQSKEMGIFLSQIKMLSTSLYFSYLYWLIKENVLKIEKYIIIQKNIEICDNIEYRRKTTIQLKLNKIEILIINSDVLG